MISVISPYENKCNMLRYLDISKIYEKEFNPGFPYFSYPHKCIIMTNDDDEIVAFTFWEVKYILQNNNSADNIEIVPTPFEMAYLYDDGNALTPTTIHILTLYVNDAVRRRGYATKMLDYIGNLYDNKLNMLLSVSTANDPAMTLYTKYGFVKTIYKANYYTDRGISYYTGEGCNAYEMFKRVQQVERLSNEC